MDNLREDPAMKSIARMSAIAATLLTAMMTAALIGVVSAAPASAHTSLTSASPADGSTVGPPTQIVLTFNEPVGFTRVLVTDAAGRRYQSGRPVNVDNTVTEKLPATPPNGRYTVAWRVVAPDGHPVEGTYQFTVTGSAATAPAAAPAAPSQTTSTSSGTSRWWIVLIALLIAVAAIGGVMLVRQSTTDAESDPEVETGAESEADPASDARADTEAGAGQ